MSADFLVRKRLDEAEVAPWKVDIVDINLQYWPHDNLLTDANGNVIFNPFEMIQPEDLDMHKQRPMWHMYFLHVDKPNTVVGISFKDPSYFEPGDYKRYPTIRDQMLLRDAEIARFDDRLDCELGNFEYRRRIYPEKYADE